VVRSEPSRQADFSTTTWSNRRCSADGCCRNNSLARLDTSGKETVLYNFAGGTDASYIHAGVIRDSAGNLYGTAAGGGAANGGVVYMLDTTGHETLLHSFTVDSAGNLYGTAGCGAANAGVVYKLTLTPE
jgi:uncharacterized repeat protein (TIGR03803 family)